MRLRFVIVAAWIAAAVAATAWLPSLDDAPGEEDTLGSLAADNSPAALNELRALELFRIPLLARSAVVQRDPDGLSFAAQRREVDRALAIGETRLEDRRGVLFALPISNGLVVLPGAGERGTTAITYLFFAPERGLLARERLARAFARQGTVDEGTYVGVTGPVPARVEQGRLITEALPMIELATVLLVALVLGAYYRSPGAPLVALVAVGLSYLVSIRVVAQAGQWAGVSVPKEVQPLLVVLLLGIVTDYSVFFLSALRHRLASGEERLAASRATSRDFTPIVVTAGLIVAAGTLSLLAGSLGFFRAFGPGLALTTLVGLGVAVTFVPAVLAILGRALFWPSLRARTPAQEREAVTSRSVARLVSTRSGAVGVAVVATVVLVVAASGLRNTELSLAPISDLPDDSPPKRAADVAAAAFAPGILAPTQLVLEERRIVLAREELAELGQLIAREPGVAGVVGPRQVPLPSSFGAVLAENGAAARYVIVLDEEPFSAAAVNHLEALRARMPELLADAGLSGVTPAFSGDTAVAGATVERIVDDLVRIAIVVVCVNFLFLVLFLRSLVAPLFLLASSVLALAATLGLATYVFQGLLGGDALTYYIPLITAVLLVSLGSDYNILVAGRIWQESRDRPLAEALAIALPRTSRTISVAGIALAGSFGLLALVPLGSFREFAFTMVVGVLIDAFVVRSFLVPALISLVGDASWWPGRRTRPRVAA